MFKRHLTAGLDIGQHYIKVVTFNSRKGRIRELWRAELFPERQSREQILQGEKLRRRLAELLKSCQKECRTFGRSVNTAIQGEGTVYSYLELPPLSDRELEVAVPSQAIRILPFPIDQVNLSYIKVPPINTKEKKLAVFLVAAPKLMVNTMKLLLKSLNLKPESLDTPVLALTREFVRNHKLPRDQFFVLIGVGFRFTQVVVLRDGFPYYAREFDLAGRDFTYAFQMGLQTSWEEAEKYKLSYNVARKQVEIEPFLTRWVDEVKKSLGFFRVKFSNQAPPPVQSVYLSGGTAAWKGLAERLSESLNLPVTVDDWEQIPSPDEPHQGCVFKVAVGLALEN